MWAKAKNKRVRYQYGKTRTWKKAIVTIAAGEQIEVFAPQQAAED
jgi:large subunit ribosomal protein L23